MTVLLMVLFIITALAVDLFLHRNKWAFGANEVSTDMYYDPQLGYTMADGGEKIKLENKNEQK